MAKPRRLSKAELKDNDRDYPVGIFLEPREWLDQAILGLDALTGGILYDYETIVECFIVKDGLSRSQACMIVDYNIDKGMGMLPEPKPVIHRAEAVEEDEYE